MTIDAAYDRINDQSWSIHRDSDGDVTLWCQLNEHCQQCRFSYAPAACSKRRNKPPISLLQAHFPEYFI